MKQSYDTEEAILLSLVKTQDELINITSEGKKVEILSKNSDVRSLPEKLEQVSYSNADILKKIIFLEENLVYNKQSIIQDTVNQIRESENRLNLKYEEIQLNIKEFQGKIDVVIENLGLLKPKLDQSTFCYPEILSEPIHTIKNQPMNRISEDVFEVLNEGETCIRIKSQQEIQNLKKSAISKMQNRPQTSSDAVPEFILKVDNPNLVKSELSHFTSKLIKEEVETQILENSISLIKQNSEKLQEEFTKLENKLVDLEIVSVNFKEQFKSIEKIEKTVENIEKDFNRLKDVSLNFKISDNFPDPISQNSLKFGKFSENIYGELYSKIFFDFETFKSDISESLQNNQTILSNKLEKFELKLEDFMNCTSVKINKTINSSYKEGILNELEKIKLKDYERDRFDQSFSNLEKFINENYTSINNGK